MSCGGGGVKFLTAVTGKVVILIKSSSLQYHATFVDRCNCLFGKCSSEYKQSYCSTVIQETNSLPFLLSLSPASCHSCALPNALALFQPWGSELLRRIPKKLKSLLQRIPKKLKLFLEFPPSTLNAACFLTTAKLLLCSGPGTYCLTLMGFCSLGAFCYTHNCTLVSL